MSITISWTKAWSNSDNGTVLNGADLGNMQSDIQTAIADVPTVAGYNAWSGNQTILGTLALSGVVTGTAATTFSSTFTSSASCIGNYSNLKVTRPSVTTVTVTADELVVKNSSYIGTTINSVSKTVDITVSGAGGLDAGVEANVWYYIYIIRKSTDGTVSSLLSTSATSPTMPTGYDQKALVSAVHNTAGDFVDFTQYGNRYTFTTPGTAYNTTTSGWTVVDTTAYVPSSIALNAFGVLWTSTSQDAQISNINTESTTITTQGTNKITAPAITSSVQTTPWMFDILTTNTLYVVGSSTVTVYIKGFYLDRV